MKLGTQKRIAGQLMKCSPKKIKFDPSRLDEIREAITKTDIRGLIGDHAISREPKRGISRVRARKIAKQKRKGLRKGPGSKKGTSNANFPTKKRWMIAIRVQRAFLKELKDKGMLTTQDYRNLYMKAKGGFFRSKRHIKLFIEEKNLVKKKGAGEAKVIAKPKIEEKKPRLKEVGQEDALEVKAEKKEEQVKVEKKPVTPAPSADKKKDKVPKKTIKKDLKKE